MQEIDGGMDRHPVQRFGRDVERLVGFLGGQRFVGVFERQKRQQLVRFKELGIQIRRLLSKFDGLAAVVLRRHQRQAQIGVGIVLVDLQSLAE